MMEFPEGSYNFYVYILTNKSRTVLYMGVTNIFISDCINIKPRRIQIVLPQNIMLSFWFIMKSLVGFNKLLSVKKKLRIYQELKKWT